jgi:hypothetical protein
MAKRIKKSELSKREKQLIELIDEKSFARRLFLSDEALQLWCDLGLPFVWYGRKKYFNWVEAWVWLESPNCLKDGTNADLVWSLTPPDMQPQHIKIIGDQTQTLPDGDYVLVKVRDD